MENQNYIGSNSNLAKGEYNDCTVRALAHSYTGSYKQAHKLLAEYGRESNKGMYRFLTVKALEDLGFVEMSEEELVNPANTRKGKYTAESFIKAHVGNDTGYNYYLFVNRHAIGVTAEGISDKDNFSGRKRIQKAFKIKK